MMTATTPMTADLAGDAIADIRAAMGILYCLAADGAVDAACMLAAVNRVEGDLAVLEAMTATPPGTDLERLGFPSKSTVKLPLRSLADIAAEAALQPGGKMLRPHLAAIDGVRQ